MKTAFLLAMLARRAEKYEGTATSDGKTPERNEGEAVTNGICAARLGKKAAHHG